MKILVVNAGSSSLKYQLIDMTNESVLAKGNCERIGIDGVIKGKTADGRSFDKTVDMPNHTVAFNEVKAALTTGDCAVIASMDEISAVGHRVVHGGSKYTQSVRIDDEVIAGIEELCALAPLHNPAGLQGIRACIEIFGKDTPQVAVFDNAFHSTMPAEAYMYAVPYEYYEKYQVRRYGFHGTSHRFVSAAVADRLGKNIEDLKIITCHIGNGSSITAVKNGKVVDTSMGFTPLDGFMMGTRSGCLDPSVVTFIQEKEGLTAAQVDNLLNKKSGMLGISGVSSDDRDIQAAMKEGNERAALGRKMQWYQIRKFVGSYAAVMNGVDAIVFTGGIGENVAEMRADICKNLTYLGVEIDEDVNAAAILGKEAKFSTAASKVDVFVIPTNEELMIARDTMALSK